MTEHETNLVIGDKIRVHAPDIDVDQQGNEFPATVTALLDGPVISCLVDRGASRGEVEVGGLGPRGYVAGATRWYLPR
ncbi:hypothetical protein B7G68_15180 [Caulobacter segnis]|uniref:Uncharacterized protein n=1 Tax=Caulobacter segnis TaxID=88688 RepID=A0ABM6TJ53_9CAUL|nr:hypothetical protein [Caulobacter segnis]AVQ03074.1 hypothetical protein B7G68_15180 [Caulobacter segnis]